MAGVAVVGRLAIGLLTCINEGKPEKMQVTPRVVRGVTCGKACGKRGRASRRGSVENRQRQFIVMSSPTTATPKPIAKFCHVSRSRMNGICSPAM